MGLLDNQTQNAYYNGNNFGTYQFTTLEHIINAFMTIYVGENKIISKVNRTDVQFHAMRAIQELSYDVFRSVKSQEIEVPNTLKMILPQDYVNYVKIVKVGSDGIERNLYPTPSVDKKSGKSNKVVLSYTQPHSIITVLP